MFRTVRSFVEKPEFAFQCDDRTCMVTARAEADLTSPETVAASQKRFMDAVVADGWIVGLDCQFCPGHAAILNANAKAQAQAKDPQSPSSGLVRPGLSDIHRLSRVR